MSDITIVAAIGAGVASLAASVVAYIALRREHNRQVESRGKVPGIANRHHPKNGAHPVDAEQSLRSQAYSVTLETTNFFFHLLNTGRIFPLFGLVLLLLILLSAIRLPEAQVTLIIKEIVSAIRGSSGILLFALLVTNVGWLWLVNRQKRIFMEEIERLSTLRSSLLKSAAARASNEAGTHKAGDA